MDIATQIPDANFDERFVTIAVESGSKLIELALDANQAMRLSRLLGRASQEAFEAQAKSNVIQLRALRHAD